MKRIVVATSLLALALLVMMFKPDAWQSDAALLKPELLSIAGSSLPVPAFAGYQNVQQKKQAFFDYFTPLVAAKNSRILAMREQVKVLARAGKVSGAALEKLNQLAGYYGLEPRGQFTPKDIERLLSHMDELPSSLVIAQAAIESAWGTSRFATEGANYFGQWCYAKGCGLVPSARHEDASHEVRAFDSAAASIDAYFKNINSHQAYKKLRSIREQSRKAGQMPSGCQLAEGLSAYSQRGVAYVSEIKSLIRVNRLEPKGTKGC